MAATRKRTTTGIRKLPNGQWQARVELPRGVDGKRRTVATNWASEGEAKTWRTDQLHAIEHKTRKVGDKTDVLTFAKRWAAAQLHKPGTRKNVGRVLARLERTPLGAAPLDDEINLMDVQEWATALVNDGYAPGTVRYIYLAKLNTIFNAAAKAGYIRRSPVDMRHISLPAVAKPKSVLTARQVHTLADAMPPLRRTMAIVQAGTGMRASELLAVRRQDVDFEAGTVRVEWQLQNGIRVDPKTNPRAQENRSRRTIQAMPHVMKTLAAHILRHTPLDDGTIFYNPATRRPLQDGGGRKTMRTAAAKVAADDPTFPAGVTSHKLRHYYATSMLYAGFTIHEVAEWLGDSPAMVVDVYGHVRPDSDDRVRQLLALASKKWTEASADEAGSEPREDSGGTPQSLRSL